MLVFFVVTKTESATKVVERFSDGINRKDTKLLRELLINEPDYVFQKSTERLRHIHSIKSTNEILISEQNQNILPILKKSPIQYSPEELVRQVIPSIFFTQNRFLTSIISEETKGDEARIRVSMGSDTLADMKYDIFLYRDQSGWKIFAVRDIELVDKYDFYAFDKEQK